MKVNVGDTIELHELTVKSTEGQVVRAVCNGSYRDYFLSHDRIKSVKPLPLKVGDWVTWGSSLQAYEIVAIRNGVAVLYFPSFLAQSEPIEKLTRVEKLE